MKKKFDIDRNLVIIELKPNEDIALGNICRLAKYYNDTKSIKSGCDCAEEIYKLFNKVKDKQ